MTASLTEALVDRRNLAARRAYRAAEALSDGRDGDLAPQVELEVALTELGRYAEMEARLGPLVQEAGGVYRRHGGPSILRDLLRHSPEADQRIVDNNRAEARVGGVLFERRDVGAGTSWATVPTWAVQDASPASINQAPLLNLLAQPMPPRPGMELRLISLTTPPVAAQQSALNAAIQEADPVDGSVGLPVKTHSIKTDLSLQLLEQGREGVDAHLIPWLTQSVDAAIGASLLTSLTTLAGASAASYTDATPTAAEFWVALEGLVRTAQNARVVGGHPLVVMHPRRLSWLRAGIATEKLSLDLAPGVDGATVSVLGSVDIVADPGVTVVNGAGTEDVVLVLPARDTVDLYLSQAMIQVMPGGSSTLSANLTASLTARRYSAFGSRAPSSVGVLSGTGLIAP